VTYFAPSPDRSSPIAHRGWLVIGDWRLVISARIRDSRFARIRIRIRAAARGTQEEHKRQKPNATKKHHRSASTAVMSLLLRLSLP
jgi:hypothetical protein